MYTLLLYLQVTTHCLHHKKERISRKKKIEREREREREKIRGRRWRGRWSWRSGAKGRGRGWGVCSSCGPDGSFSTATCPPPYCHKTWFFFFFCSDSIRLMRKIVFVFQIFQLCFVFLFLLWYVLPCNRWDREREREEWKRKEMSKKESLFYLTGDYFKSEKYLELLQ